MGMILGDSPTTAGSADRRNDASLSIERPKAVFDVTRHQLPPAVSNHGINGIDRIIYKIIEVRLLPAPAGAGGPHFGFLLLRLHV